MKIQEVKYLLRTMIEDVHGALGVGILVMDTNGKIILASEDLEHYEGLMSPERYKSELALVMERDIICYRWGDSGTAKYITKEDLRDNYNEIISEWDREYKDATTITMAIKSGTSVVGAMGLYLSKEMTEQPPVRMFCQIKMIDLIATLIGNRLQYINQVEIRSIEEVEKEMMLKALERYGNSSFDITRISEKLGMNRSTFYRKCKKYEIDIHKIWD